MHATALFGFIMKILFKNSDFLVALKPSGIPTQPDPTKDKDAMTYLSEILSENGENSELWLIHRLDRVDSGLLVFARNKKSAKILSELAANSGLQKGYLAVVEGKAEGGTLVDYLYKDSMSSKAYVCTSERRGAKKAELSYTLKAISENEGVIKSLVDIRLITGRFHQIRAQFSSRGHSLSGDKKYGNRDGRAKSPALFAYSLKFELFGEKYEFSVMPDSSEYPWCLFDL